MNGMDRAAEALREARYDYETAEHNLAVARAKLTRAERLANGIFRKMVDPDLGKADSA